MVRKIIDIRRTIPRHTTRKWKKRKAIDLIVIHTTASNQQDPVKTAKYHITPGKDNHLSKKGAPGIAYHDFIDKDGRLYHCNNYMDITWHAGLWNGKSVGIAMAFKGQTGEAPSYEQSLRLVQHLVILCLYLKVLPKKIKGHREAPGMVTILGNGSKRYRKTCPGWGVNLDLLRQEVTRRLQVRLASEKLYKGSIDGDFGPLSRAALNAFDPTTTYRSQLVKYRSKYK